MRKSLLDRRRGLVGGALLLCGLFHLGFQVVGEDGEEPRRLTIPQTSKERGEFTLPVMLSDGEGILGIQFKLSFDSDILEVLAIRPGTLLTDHEVVLNTVFPDDITAAIVSLQLAPLNPGPGSVLEVDFRSMADQDAEFELFGALASGVGGATIQVQSITIPDLETRSIPLIDAPGILFLILTLLLSGLFVLKKGTLMW